MPRRCGVYGCRGNYRCEPYTKTVVSFPTDEETRSKWITALPNDSRTLGGRKEIWICVTHFEGEWVTMREGKRPLNPPSIFSGVTKSCFKQVQYKERRAVPPQQEEKAKIKQMNKKIKSKTLENL